MKIEIKKAESFRPYKIEITIETQSEEDTLKTIVAGVSAKVFEAANTDRRPEKNKEASDDTWHRMSSAIHHILL